MFKKFLLGAVASGALFAGSAAHASTIYYQQGFSNNLYKFDTVTLAESLVGSLGLSSDSTGMAFSQGGTLYLHERASQSLYTVNTTTGAATLVGSTGIGAEDLTISLDGTTGYATFGGQLYSINLATGAANALGGIGFDLDGLTTAAVAVTINGVSYAAGSIFGVDSGSIYAVNVVAPALTLIGSNGGADETFDFGSDGTLFGHGDNGNFYRFTLDPLSSSVLGATTPGLVFGMAVAPDARGGVPEPAAWALMLAGFGLVGGALRRRERQNALA